MPEPVAFLDERSTIIDELVDVAAAQLFLRLRLRFFPFGAMAHCVAPKACSAAPCAPAALRGTNGLPVVSGRRVRGTGTARHARRCGGY